MKTLFLPILIALMLTTAQAQDLGSAVGAAISLTGDSNTEQAAKLELIRILQERANKLSVAQLNSRIVVSRGIKGYYKVDEIYKMNSSIYVFRSKYVAKAGKLEQANPGFAATGGNGFAYNYMAELNNCCEKAKIINEQLDVLVTSGQPVVLPALPTFNISPASSGSSAGGVASSTEAIMASFGVHSQADFDKLDAATKQAIYDKVKQDNVGVLGATRAAETSNNAGIVALIGNVVGAAFGVPVAGSMLVGLANGGANAALGALVGSIVDQFQIPLGYYDSNTLKLTDAERIKMIDELHLRISELYQQVTALGASMSSETKTRYNELAQPRNEQILYGPKK
jgi:hypothetical protein